MILFVVHYLPITDFLLWTISLHLRTYVHYMQYICIFTITISIPCVWSRFLSKAPAIPLSTGPLKKVENSFKLKGTVAPDFCVSFLICMKRSGPESVPLLVFKFFCCSFDLIAIFSLWNVSYQNSWRSLESPVWFYKFVWVPLINPPSGGLFQVADNHGGKLAANFLWSILDVILQIVELSLIILINCRFISANLLAVP